jgi:hypothetical protein
VTDNAECPADPELVALVTRLVPLATKGHIHWQGVHTNCERCNAIDDAKAVMERLGVDPSR